METKSWYKSKAIIAGIVGILIAVYNAATPGLCESFKVCLPAIPEFAYAILAGLGIYGRVDAKTKIGA